MAKTAPQTKTGNSKGANMSDLEKAKAAFAEANKAFQDKKALVTKAKRLSATGQRKLDALDKKIAEVKEQPNKAVEILLKKTEELKKRTKELDSPDLKSAEGIEKQIKVKEAELEKVKKETDAKMEELGISTKAVRAPSTGSAAEKRAKNNFQYRLKTKGWNLNYNTSGRIESAEKYGLTVVFGPDDFTVEKGGSELLKHPYGEGSLLALSDTTKKHGEGVDADA